MVYSVGSSLLGGEGKTGRWREERVLMVEMEGKTGSSLWFTSSFYYAGTVPRCVAVAS
jgi:hypothetical protein